LGFQYERFEEDAATKQYLYYSVFRRIDDTLGAVEDRIVSVSNVDVLTPRGFQYVQLVGGKETKKWVGEYKADRKAMVFADKTSVAVPPSGASGVIFSGMFPLMLKRQKLKSDETLKTTYFMEDTKTFMPGFFKLIGKDDKAGLLQVRNQVGDQLFDFWVDGGGWLVRSKSSDGALVVEKTTEEKASTSWPENKKFGAFSKPK
jgi:hypothetical protein